nr:hypothetical protein [uncultured Desulfobacter sp.]
MEEKEYVNAELEFRNAVQIDPEYADAFFMLGQIELKKKILGEPVGCLKKPCGSILPIFRPRSN